MPLGEVVRKHTHREMMTTLYWLSEQWNEPGKSDYYIIQLTYMLACMFSEEGKEPDIENFILRLAGGKKPEINIELGAEELREERERLIMNSKAVWFARTGKLPEKGK